MDGNKEMKQAVMFHDPNDTSWMQKQAATFDPKRKDPESRKYLVLVWFNEQQSSEIENSFIIAEGRSDAYFAIKNLIEVMDVEKSVVYLEGNTLILEDTPGIGNIVTVLSFLRHVRDNELVEDDTAYIIDNIIAEFDDNYSEEDN